MNNLKKLVGAYYPRRTYSYSSNSIGFMGGEGLSIRIGTLFKTYEKHEVLCPSCYYNVLVWHNYYEAKEYGEDLLARCTACDHLANEHEVLVGEIYEKKD